jgi:uncharacterized protein (DUF1684 family)
VPGDGSRTVDVPNVLGDVTHTNVAGEARFNVNGQEIHLSALGGDPAKGPSFIFSDATRKTETYPAGRFLESGPGQRRQQSRPMRLVPFPRKKTS